VLLFGGVSGSAIADTAAIGSLVIPAMLAKGYSRGFAAALVAVAGTLALLMPLSIPFLVYAFISGVSMRTLSMAGLVPAIISAIALIAVCMWHGQKTGVDPGGKPASLGAIAKAATVRAPPVDACLHRGRYLVGLLHAHRGRGCGRGLRTGGVDVSVQGHVLQGHPHLLLKAFMTSATVMLVIGATGALAWLITAEGVAQQLADWVRLGGTREVGVSCSCSTWPWCCWASSSSRCQPC
jgi:C4-dicarboxylate transporter DctM subunit